MEFPCRCERLSCRLPKSNLILAAVVSLGLFVCPMGLPAWCAGVYGCVCGRLCAALSCIPKAALFKSSATVNGLTRVSCWSAFQSIVFLRLCPLLLFDLSNRSKTFNYCFASSADFRPSPVARLWLVFFFDNFAPPAFYASRSSSDICFM